MPIEPCAAENRLDFMTQRARGDPERISRRHQLDARCRTWIEDVSRLDSRLDAGIEDARLLVDQRANTRAESSGIPCRSPSCVNTPSSS